MSSPCLHSMTSCLLPWLHDSMSPPMTSRTSAHCLSALRASARSLKPSSRTGGSPLCRSGPGPSPIVLLEWPRCRLAVGLGRVVSDIKVDGGALCVMAVLLQGALMSYARVVGLSSAGVSQQCVCMRLRSRPRWVLSGHPWKQNVSFMWQSESWLASV